METQNGIKPQNDFFMLNKECIIFIYEHQLEGCYNSLDLLAPTVRKCQIPSFTRTNWKEAPTP